MKQLAGGLDRNQFGFVKNHSTTDAIQAVVTGVKEAKEAKEYCALVSLNIAGAFDNAWWPPIILEMHRRLHEGN